MTNFFIATTFLLLGILIPIIFYLYHYWRMYLKDGVEEELPEPPQFMETPQFEGQPRVIKMSLADILKNASEIEQEDEMNEAVFKNVTNKANFKKTIQDKLHKVVNDGSDDWEKATHLRDLLKDVDTWYEVRKKWFLDRIGRKVRPNVAECPCETCQASLKEGVIIINETVALSLFAQENRSKLNMGELEYFDYE